MSKLTKTFTIFNLQRVLAGIVFIPLLAYCFAPFHEMKLSFPLRLVFWAGVLAVALGSTWVARNFVREKLKTSGLLIRDVAFVLLILTLFAPSLWFLAWMVFTFDGQVAPSLTSAMPYGVTFAVGLLLVRQREEEGPEPEPELPRLYSRLPDTFRGQIYRLTVRDHCVDVVTSEGIFTIRSRFTDAIEDMEPIAGHCTHRSHWVTENTIVGPVKEGGKTYLKLANDDLVPVSRKYRPELEKAGLV